MRNAIQAVLAGLSGGLEGRAMQRTREDELRRLDEERLYQRQRDSAASERQALQDAVALAEKGYVEQGERAETVKRATPALQSAMFNAVSSIKGGPMVAPVNPQALQAAAGQFGPAVSTVNVGGKTLERAQTPMQERQMLAAQERDQTRFDAQQERERASRDRQGDVQEKIRQLGAVYGAELDKDKLALVASGQAKLEDFIEKPLNALERTKLAIEQGRLGIDRARLKLDQDKFNRENTPAPSGGQTSGGPAVDNFPGVVEAVNYFKGLTPDRIKNIRPTGANAASVSQANSGTWSGLLGSMVVSPLTNEEEQVYAEQSRIVSNAVARLREKGVLSNQDITRFESQVGGVAGQSKSSMDRKIARAAAWAEWLSSPAGVQAMEKAAKTPGSPGLANETPAEKAIRTGGGPF